MLVTFMFEVLSIYVANLVQSKRIKLVQNSMTDEDNINFVTELIESFIIAENLKNVIFDFG